MSDVRTTPTTPLARLSGARRASGTGFAPVSELGARRRRSLHGVLLMLLLVITLGALARVAVHLRQLEVGLALGKARNEHAMLMEARRKAMLEIGVLKAPERIMAIAREKLGLRPPETGDIVALDRLDEVCVRARSPRVGRRPRSAERGDARAMASADGQGKP